MPLILGDEAGEGVVEKTRACGKGRPRAIPSVIIGALELRPGSRHEEMAARRIAISRRAEHPDDRVDGAVMLANECQLVDRSERSEEHTSELQSLMRISYAVFCLQKKKQ